MTPAAMMGVIRRGADGIRLASSGPCTNTRGARHSRRRPPVGSARCASRIRVTTAQWNVPAPFTRLSRPSQPAEPGQRGWRRLTANPSMSVFVDTHVRDHSRQHGCKFRFCGTCRCVSFDFGFGWVRLMGRSDRCCRCRGRRVRCSWLGGRGVVVVGVVGVGLGCATACVAGRGAEVLDTGDGAFVRASGSRHHTDERAARVFGTGSSGHPRHLACIRLRARGARRTPARATRAAHRRSASCRRRAHQ
jgi:hypothetical protein